MSDTPRCNELINKHGFSTTRNGDKAVLVSDYRFSEDAFALARELETELAEARAEIERKDKLIEQMREALRLALPEARSTHVEWVIKIALKAERGE